MNYEIINSGSDGNAVVIEKNILIDCGVSFAKLRKYYQNLKIVLLTHIHRDHFNKMTIKKLANERPTLRFACCEWLVKDLIDCSVDKRNIDVLELGKRYSYSEFSVEPIVLHHDVPNCGYKIAINNKKMIYATDTNSLEHIEAKGFNLYLIEGNYTIEELRKRAIEKENNGVYAYEHRVETTHLSKEAANEWLVNNMSNDSVFVYMHEHKER